MRVITLVENGFEELEAIGTIALLKRAGIEVDIVSFNKDVVKGQYDISFSNILDFKKINKEDYDMLFIPGGRHYKLLEERSEVLDLINYFAKEKIISAICAAPTILGRLGILKNKKYTCFTSMNEDFGGTYIDTYVVQDNNIITARSAAAAIELGFQIINTLLSEDKEAEIKKQIYY